MTCANTPPPSRRRRTPRFQSAPTRWGLIGILCVLLLSSLGLEWLWRHAEYQPAQVAALAEDATSGMQPTDGDIVPAANMPPTPLPGQRRPPCSETQVAINGACWWKADRAPPCKELYRHGEACYIPAAEGQKRQPMTGGAQ
jgi:hypothetical protein